MATYTERVDIKHEIMPDKTIGVRVTTVTM